MIDYKKLKVASLQDIVTSKLDAILTRDKARDFVDFYFIQKNYPFKIDFILEKLKKMFSVKIDPLYLAGSFQKVEKLKDYPKMIKPFSREKMIAYFLDLARSQKSKIIK